MKIEIKYVSVLGEKFDSAKGAIEDEKRLPLIIAAYEKDIAEMDKTGCFGDPVSKEFIENWKKIVVQYKALWEEAQESHKRIHRVAYTPWADDSLEEHESFA